MKRAILVLLVLSLTRVGVAYADTTSAKETQNYFFGVKNAASNLNQVLALLVGPQGRPGPAGVAGRDGLIGMNGVDGKDGLPGAPGVAGEPGRDGASVVAVAFTGNQGSCTTGGTRFTDGAGNITYACNGATGAAGATGATGPQGPAGPAGATGATGPQGPAGTGGGGGGGSLGFGQGEVTAGGCEADGKIVINFGREFTGTDFVFSQFKLGNTTVTDGDIKDTCAGKVVSLYFKITTGTLKNGSSAGYTNNDIIKCTKTLQSAAGWPTGNPQFTFASSDLNCINQRSNATVAFNQISTADYTDVIGFEIG